MSDDFARDIREQCAGGLLPATVGLMRLVLAARSREELETWIASQDDLAALWRRSPDFWSLAKTLQAAVNHEGEQPPSAVAQAFDRAAALSPDAASALYALADPQILAEATAEVVDYLNSHGLLGAGVRVLDIGCGSGRFEAALASRVKSVLGLEISAGMAEAARRRCADLANVEIALCPQGAPPEAPTCELVIAVDSFPYIAASPGPLAAQWFAQIARSLVAGGQFVICNYSYGGDVAADCAHVAALAGANGMTPIEMGDRPFRHWDGVTFRLRKT